MTEIIDYHAVMAIMRLNIPTEIWLGIESDAPSDDLTGTP